MEADARHRQLTAKLFISLDSHEDALYYTGSRWTYVEGLVLLGTGFYVRVNYPYTKASELDPRAHPIMWRHNHVCALVEQPMFDVKIRYAPLFPNNEYKAFRQLLKVTKHPPIMTSTWVNERDKTPETHLMYFEEADAVMARAIMESA